MSEVSMKVIDVTCALIIDDQNRLFAAQRSSTMSLPLKWELPGGKVKKRESLPDAGSQPDPARADAASTDAS